MRHGRDASHVHDDAGQLDGRCAPLDAHDGRCLSVAFPNGPSLGARARRPVARFDGARFAFSDEHGRPDGHRVVPEARLCRSVQALVVERGHESSFTTAQHEHVTDGRPRKASIARQFFTSAKLSSLSLSNSASAGMPGGVLWYVVTTV